MGAATIVTLLGVAIIVAAIALYLIIISVTLNHVSYTLGTVIIGVKAIVAQTDPVPKYVCIILIAVVAPVCLLFLNRVLRPIFEIKRYVDDVLDHGVKLTGTLDCVPNLIRSCELTGSARLNVTRYGLALARLLPQ